MPMVNVVPQIQEGFAKRVSLKIRVLPHLEFWQCLGPLSPLTFQSQIPWRWERRGKSTLASCGVVCVSGQRHRFNPTAEVKILGFGVSRFNGVRGSGFQGSGF